MLFTTSSSTSRSPSKFSVQRAHPTGGAEQASIVSFASPSPSSLRGLPFFWGRRPAHWL
ncbi:MAG: hypothetical protein OXC26_20560 [Albidovulum sp.]|nr:hypothetical protein [Albidovulum sp.]